MPRRFALKIIPIEKNGNIFQLVNLVLCVSLKNNPQSRTIMKKGQTNIELVTRSSQNQAPCKLCSVHCHPRISEERKNLFCTNRHKYSNNEQHFTRARKIKIPPKKKSQIPLTSFPNIETSTFHDIHK